VLLSFLVFHWVRSTLCHRSHCVLDLVLEDRLPAGVGFFFALQGLDHSHFPYDRVLRQKGRFSAGVGCTLSLDLARPRRPQRRLRHATGERWSCSGCSQSGASCYAALPVLVQASCLQGDSLGPCLSSPFVPGTMNGCSGPYSWPVPLAGGRTLVTSLWSCVSVFL